MPGDRLTSVGKFRAAGPILKPAFLVELTATSSLPTPAKESPPLPLPLQHPPPTHPVLQHREHGRRPPSPPRGPAAPLLPISSTPEIELSESRRAGRRIEMEDLCDWQQGDDGAGGAQ